MGPAGPITLIEWMNEVQEREVSWLWYRWLASGELHLLGGIGGMAPTRRGDLARLGSRALLAGFLATLINACVASMLL